jgi:hypothetical protein
MKRLFYSLLLSLFLVVGAHGQSVEGDWQGTLKAGGAELRLVLHVTKDDKGGLKATLDSPDQNSVGVPATSIALADSTLKFEMRMIDGSYEGKVNTDRTNISGTWTQGGSSAPLEFSRVAANSEARKKALKPSDIDGEWEGTLDAGSQSLRLVLHIMTYEDGMTAKLDSPDQNATGLPVTTITRDAAKLKFEMKQIAGGFEGTINQELNSISGTWTQGGGSLPLTLKRKNAAPKEKKPSSGM